MLNHMPSIVRFRHLARPFGRTVLLLVAFVASVASTACVPDPFVARSVYFDSTKCRQDDNKVALVALSNSEMAQLRDMDPKIAKVPNKRNEELTKKLDGPWKGRAVVKVLAGKQENHQLVGENSPEWKAFRKSKRTDRTPEEPMEWMVLLVLDTNWDSADKSSKDGWYAFYRGGPDDEFGDLPSVDFAWAPTEGRNGAPKVATIPPEKD